MEHFVLCAFSTYAREKVCCFVLFDNFFLSLFNWAIVRKNEVPQSFSMFCCLWLFIVTLLILKRIGELWFCIKELVLHSIICVTFNFHENRYHERKKPHTFLFALCNVLLKMIKCNKFLQMLFIRKYFNASIHSSYNNLIQFDNNFSWCHLKWPIIDLVLHSECLG